MRHIQLKSANKMAAMIIAAIVANPMPIWASEGDSVAMTRALPFWAQYLALAPVDRDGLILEYRVHTRAGTPPQIFMLYRGQRTPIAIGPDGVLRPPTDVRVVREAQVTAEQTGGGVQISLDVRPNIALGRTISISAIQNAIGDYRTAKRSAGPLAIAAPNLTRVAFSGGSNGVAVFADGHTSPLPREDGKWVVAPNGRALRGAVSVRFDSAPNAAAFLR